MPGGLMFTLRSLLVDTPRRSPTIVDLEIKALKEVVKTRTSIDQEITATARSLHLDAHALAVVLMHEQQPDQRSLHMGMVFYYGHPPETSIQRSRGSPINRHNCRVSPVCMMGCSGS